MNAEKRNSVLLLILFEAFMTVLLVVIDTDIYRDLKALRVGKLESDSHLLGEWIRDSHTASGYLMKGILGIIPEEEVRYPPLSTNAYHDAVERVSVLSNSFPHNYLSGIVDDVGILTHSLDYDGMDMTQYPFYDELSEKTAGSFYFSDAFEMESGDWAVCHALKSVDPERNIAAVMVIKLEFFEEWLSRLEPENVERILVMDSRGYILAGDCNGECKQKIVELNTLTENDPVEEGRFRLLKGGEGDLYALYRIQGLPYTVVFINPVIVSLTELLLPLVIIMIGYSCVVVLGFAAFHSHLSQINLNRILDKTSSEMTAIFEHSMVGIIMLNDRYCITRANVRFSEILGYASPDEISGMSISDFYLSSESFRRFVVLYRKEMRISGIVKMEYEFRRKDGSPMWARIVGKPLDLQNKSGVRKTEIWIAEDISDRRAAEQKLKELASTDSMTGIANRRCFMEAAEREFANSYRYKRPLSAMMLDIDHFKAVNDRFGHAIGDKAIILVVDICRKSLRTGDLFGRIGGEEFAFVLPDTDVGDAALVAERIRAMVEEETRGRDDGIPHFTVSMGLAEASKTDKRFEVLLQRADKALYKAKGNGRNRVCRL